MYAMCAIRVCKWNWLLLFDRRNPYDDDFAYQSQRNSEILCVLCVLCDCHTINRFFLLLPNGIDQEHFVDLVAKFVWHTMSRLIVSITFPSYQQNVPYQCM